MAQYGVKPIRNLCGHGLGRYQIHTAPSIPNYNNHSKGVVKPGMTFAIEPFATTGKGLIYEEEGATIFSQQKGGRVRSEIGHALLAKIKTFQGLPFAIHDLVTPEIPLAKVFTGLKELLKGDAINAYGPLLEEEQGMVAQAENSVLVDEDGSVFITTR